MSDTARGYQSNDELDRQVVELSRSRPRTGRTLPIAAERQMGNSESDRFQHEFAETPGRRALLSKSGFGARTSIRQPPHHFAVVRLRRFSLRRYEDVPGCAEPGDA